MITILLTLAIGFIVGEGVGYLIHRTLHSPLAGTLYQKHMTHHLKLYPITDFYSEKYRSPGKDNTVIIFSAIMAVVLGLVFIFFPLRIALIVSAEFISIGFLNNYLHDIFHIHPNWLEKYEWFRKLQRVHFRHHEDMSKNYGIFTFFGDRIFGTFSDTGRRASN